MLGIVFFVWMRTGCKIGFECMQENPSKCLAGFSTFLPTVLSVYTIPFIFLNSVPRICSQNKVKIYLTFMSFSERTIE